MGEVEVIAAGLAEYEPGDEVVLFLEPFGAYYVTIGIGIGTYDVRTHGPEAWVHHEPHVTGARFVPGSVPRLEPIRPMVPQKLPNFLKTVRSYARNMKLRPQAIDKATKTVIMKPKLTIPQGGR